MHYDIWGKGYPASAGIMPELANLLKVRLTFAKVFMDKPINFSNFDTISLCNEMSLKKRFVSSYDFQ